MKKLFPFLAALALLAGCARRYDIIMTNGMKVSGVSKPVYHKETGEYFFVDGAGRHMAVKEMRVRGIEPHENSDPNAQFKNVAPK